MQGTNFDGFEWDEEKSEHCRHRREFDFEFAAKLFTDEFLEWEDRRRPYGEPRFVAIGEVEHRALVVVWTPRGRLRRIISARLASRRERKQFDEYREAHQQANS